MDEDCQSDFSPELFVGRETELQELIRWITAKNVSRRLKTIAGPPGYGKSWLLCRLEKNLHENGRHGRDLFIVRVPIKTIKSRQNVIAWLPSVIESAQRSRPEVRSFDPAASLETVISHLLEDLCENCDPTLRPILLVDAFDELFENERKVLEKQLLEQFWTHDSVRIVMAFRDELSLVRPTLRRGEERSSLQIFSPEMGQNQLQKLATDNPSLKPEAVLLLIPPYNWIHPKINSCLYATARKKAQNPSPLQFVADDLRNCWVPLIEQKVTEASLTLSVIESDLKAIVATNDTWTLETFAEVCNYEPREAHSHIENLMALSVVSQAHGQRYQVIAGLRELLCAENQLREEE